MDAVDFSGWVTMTQAANMLGISRQRMAILLDSRSQALPIEVMTTPLGRVYSKRDVEAVARLRRKVFPGKRRRRA